MSISQSFGASALAVLLGALAFAACSSGDTVPISDPAAQPRSPAPFAEDSLAKWEDSPTYVFDSQGVPMVDYGNAYSKAGRQYNPVSISQYAQALYKQWAHNGSDLVKDKFVAQADWLVSNAVDRGGYVVWEYQFPHSKYGVESPPWVSGMAQGEVLTVLVEAHSITGDVRYTQVAEQALQAFGVEMAHGGVTTRVGSDGYWYEEVASPQAVSSRILNGHLFALAGILQYYEYTGDPKALPLYEAGLRAVREHIPEYDTGDWSRYDLIGTMATDFYHGLHARQLGYFYEQSGDETLKRYADLFDSYVEAASLETAAPPK